MMKIKQSPFENVRRDSESEALLESFVLDSSRNRRTAQERIYGNIFSILLILGALIMTYFLYCVTKSRQSESKFTSNVSGHPLLIVNDSFTEESIITTQTPVKITPDQYLINGAGCKLPALDPFGKDVMALFHQQRPQSCSTKPPLTYIVQIWHNDTVFLHVNNSAVKHFVTNQNDSLLRCCYQDISRAADTDDKINFTSCHSFDLAVQLQWTSEFIMVKCDMDGEAVYINGHALVRKKVEVTKRFKEVEKKEKPLSVLLIGIDSISRLNFIRSMPNTAQYLHSTGWMELQGYNKMGDNTFPNLMAILTGFNSTRSYGQCTPTSVGKLDACPMLWYTFREQGYATAYAEDEMSINTFNYHKTGFVKPPVDHYFHPFGIAAEKYLHKKKLNGLDVCLGYQTYADFIYQYAIDFATQYKGNPYFGLFWTSSFSHNDLSTASCMDDRMKDYMVMLQETGILNETLVVFFSDHGIRFGDVRKLLTGWYEERLPFIFFSLPDWFKQKHPETEKNFKINRNRLTTPYDFHVTLKHVLSLSGTNISLTAPSCPSCQSLFEEVPDNRSCDDASIVEHWCTCIPYVKYDKHGSDVKEAVNFAMQYINDDLQEYKAKHEATSIYTNKCATLEVSEIIDAYLGQGTQNNTTYYLVTFKAHPGGGEFEATVKYKQKTGHQLSGSISRLNMYGTQANCINNGGMKNYCFCQK